MNKKRYMVTFAILLVLSMLIGACSQKNTETPPTPSQGPEAEDKINRTGIPIVDKPVTLNFVTTKFALQTKPTQDLKVVKDFEQLTNMQIKWQDIPIEGYQEKKNLIFASGEWPDAFFGVNALSDADIANYGSQGILLPLQDLIEEYAPTIKQLFEQYPEIKKFATAPDGNIYSVPTILERDFLTLFDAAFINKKWLDELGLPVPETIEEFEAALLAFKNSDPNRNGKPDEIPFSFLYGDDARYALHSMFGSFGRLDNPEHVVLEDGKAVFTASQPEYKEALKYFHKLYSQGLIDPESFTQDLTVYFSKGKNKEAPIIGAFVGWNSTAMAGDRSGDYVPLPPLKSSSGKQIWNKYFGETSRSGFAITINNSQPEASIRWIDEIYTEKHSMEWQFGPIDLNIKIKEDGTYGFLPEPNGMTNGEFRHSESPGNQAARAMTQERYAKVENNESQNVKQSLYDFYSPFMVNSAFPKVFFSPEDADRLAILKTDLFSYIDQSVASWILKGNIDNEWDGYVQKLKQMGEEELTGLYQKYYEAQ